jgi:hypothetical protein
VTCDFAGALGGTRAPNLLIRSKIRVVQHRLRVSVLPALWGIADSESFRQNPRPSTPVVSKSVSKIGPPGPATAAVFKTGNDDLVPVPLTCRDAMCWVIVMRSHPAYIPRGLRRAAESTAEGVRCVEQQRSHDQVVNHSEATALASYISGDINPTAAGPGGRPPEPGPGWPPPLWLTRRGAPRPCGCRPTSHRPRA